MSTSGNLAVFPLESTNEEDPHFLLLGEAMARYGAKVVERGAERGGATVGRIVFHNKAPLDVLLLDGEELRGGLQNRVVNKSILVPAHTELEIPVSCVERGRWSREAHGGALRRRRARSTENKPPLPPFAFGPTDPGPREPSPTHEQEARRSAPPSWVPGCSCPACLDALERSGVAPLDRMKEQDLSLTQTISTAFSWARAFRATSCGTRHRCCRGLLGDTLAHGARHPEFSRPYGMVSKERCAACVYARTRVR